MSVETKTIVVNFAICIRFWRYILFHFQAWLISSGHRFLSLFDLGHEVNLSGTYLRKLAARSLSIFQILFQCFDFLMILMFLMFSLLSNPFFASLHVCCYVDNNMTKTHFEAATIKKICFDIFFKFSQFFFWFLNTFCGQVDNWTPF